MISYQNTASDPSNSSRLDIQDELKVKGYGRQSFFNRPWDFEGLVFVCCLVHDKTDMQDECLQMRVS